MCVCVCVCDFLNHESREEGEERKAGRGDREKEKVRDRQTDRQTKTGTETVGAEEEVDANDDCRRVGSAQYPWTSHAHGAVMLKRHSKN